MDDWAITFETCSPYGPERGTLKVGIPRALFRAALGSDDWVMLGKWEMARQVLEGRVAAIYEGWNRPGQELSYVYSGIPAQEIIRPRNKNNGEIARSFPDEMTLLIFVLEDGSIDEVAIRRMNGKQPDGIQGRQLWP